MFHEDPSINLENVTKTQSNDTTNIEFKEEIEIMETNEYEGDNEEETEMWSNNHVFCIVMEIDLKKQRIMKKTNV
jgi:uncharacterized protein with WD repeat